MPKRLKIQIKNATRRSDRLRFAQFKLILYSKLPLTRRNLSHRPPPVTGIFAVNLPHYIYIKSTSFNFVKRKILKNQAATRGRPYGIASGFSSSFCQLAGLSPMY